jgi:hypothetical protein
MEIESEAHKAATESPACGVRGVVRRAVQIGCSVRSELWDGPAPFLATDLSPDGLRLCSPLALPEGQDVVVTFTPPRWPDESGPLNVVARVEHVALPRRKSDPLVAGMPGEAGMGLSFLHIDPTQRALLHLVLRGLPPPLPSSRSNEEAQLALDELETVLCHDGLQIQLAAEAPLLTAARPRVVSEPLSHASGFTSASVLRRRFRSFRLRPRGSEPQAPVASEPIGSELRALH